MSGIMVDMDAVVNSLWAKNDDANVSKTVGQQVGMMISALEHRVLELFFTNEEYPGEAVSAVKALAVASAQGQRIYQITQKNVNAVLPTLNIGVEVKDEIRASVTVGKEATVSQNNVTVNGWTGVGYIITDPETGAGAYRISGGGNGGITTFQSVYKFIFSALFLLGTLTVAILALLFFYTFVIIAVLALLGLLVAVMINMKVILTALAITAVGVVLSQFSWFSCEGYLWGIGMGSTTMAMIFSAYAIGLGIIAILFGIVALLMIVDKMDTETCRLSQIRLYFKHENTNFLIEAMYV